LENKVFVITDKWCNHEVHEIPDLVVCDLFLCIAYSTKSAWHSYRTTGYFVQINIKQSPWNRGNCI